MNIDERLHAIAESLELLTRDLRAVNATLQKLGATVQNLAISMHGLFAVVNVHEGRQVHDVRITRLENPTGDDKRIRNSDATTSNQHKKST